MKSSFSRMLALLLALVMTLALVACGGNNGGNNAGNTDAGNTSTNTEKEDAPAAEKEYKDTLVWAQGADVTSLDPHTGKETPAVEVHDQIFDTLVDVEDGEVVPEIAESWEQIDDVTWKFNIRKDVKFHDGSQLTAEDVKFSLDRAIASAHVSYIIDFVESVTVDDEYTVTVKTYEPFGPILRHLAIPYAAIVPKAIVEADEATWILNPVGSGPYTFVEWNQGQNIKLKAFADYMDGVALTENLEMRVVPETAQRAMALETGEIDVAYDLAVNDIPKIEANDSTSVLKIPSLSCYYLSVNLQKAPFDNALVREAISIAIDRQALVDTINAGSGSAADCLLAPNVFGYVSTGVKEYNVEKAKELMAEAGYADGFSTTLVVNDNQSRIEMCQAIQAMLLEIGITVEISVMEFGSFIQHTSNGEHEMAYFGWTTSSGDADYTYGSVIHSKGWGSQGNRTFLADDEIDAWVMEARALTDEAARMELYTKIAEKLDTINCNFPILYTELNVGINNNVEGWVMDVNGFHEIHEVRVAK